VAVKLGDAYVAITVQKDSLHRGLKESKSYVEMWGQDVRKAVNHQMSMVATDVGTVVGGIARVALNPLTYVTAIGAAGAMGAKSAIEIGMSYETAFTGVRKTVNATEGEFKALSGQIRQMARDIPATREAISGVGEAAGQLGIAKGAIIDFSRTMIDLGNTSNLSAERGADALARFANITQMSQANFGRLGSTVVDLGNNFASTEAEIVDMGLRLAGAGHQVKMTEAQILGLATALSSLGIESELGGSSFSRVIADMASAVATGGDALKEFSRVAGMSPDKFATLFNKDAASAIIAFVEGLGRINKEGGNVFQTLESLGLAEIRVRDTLLRAAGAGDLMRQALETGNKAWKENIALTAEAEKRYATTESKIKVMENRWSDLGVSLFGFVQRPLNGLIDAWGRVPVNLEAAGRYVVTLGGQMRDLTEATDNQAAALGRIHQPLKEYNTLLLSAHGATDRLDLGLRAAHTSTLNLKTSLIETNQALRDYLGLLDRSQNINIPNRPIGPVVSPLEQAKKDLGLATMQAIDDQQARFDNEYLRDLWDKAEEERTNKTKSAAREAGEAIRKALTEALEAARRKVEDLQAVFDRFLRTPVTGSGMFRDRINALTDQLEVLRLRQLTLGGQRGARQELRSLAQQRAGLERELGLLQQTETVVMGPQRRAIADAANPLPPEMDAGAIIAAINAYRPALDTANAALRNEAPAEAEAAIAALAGRSPEDHRTFQFNFTMPSGMDMSNARQVAQYVVDMLTGSAFGGSVAAPTQLAGARR
jgi:TP901 family phage tail tape measure protein